MIAEARYFLPSIFSFLIDELLVSNFYNYTLQLTHLSLAQVCVSRNNCPLRYLTKILLLVNNNLVLLQRHSVYNDCKKYWHTPFSFNKAFLRQVLPFVFVTWNDYLVPTNQRTIAVINTTMRQILPVITVDHHWRWTNDTITRTIN